MKGRNLFLVVLLAGFLLLYFTSETDEKIMKREANVTRVVDGDTIIVDGGGEVRLMGIDSTEVGDECSDEAKRWLSRSIGDSEILLETVGKGTYGRNLSYVFQGDINVNRELVEKGLAYTYYFDTEERYIDELIEAEKGAMKKDRGCLWRRELTISDPVYACEAEENISEVVVVEGKVEEVNQADGMTYLNFGEEHPNNCFTAIVWDGYRQRFDSGPMIYENRTIRVEGLVTSYRGKPQVEIRDPAQINVLG